MCRWLCHKYQLRRTIKNDRKHLLQDIIAAEFFNDFQSTDVAKGNYFRRVVVTVKSQKSAKYIMRVTFPWPRTSDSRSNELVCSKQVVTTVSQEWAKNILWNQKVIKVHSYVKSLWMYSPFADFCDFTVTTMHPTKVITICSRLIGKIQRWRYLE